MKRFFLSLFESIGFVPFRLLFLSIFFATERGFQMLVLKSYFKFCGCELVPESRQDSEFNDAIVRFRANAMFLATHGKPVNFKDCLKGAVCFDGERLAEFVSYVHLVFDCCGNEFDRLGSEMKIVLDEAGITDEQLRSGMPGLDFPIDKKSDSRLAYIAKCRHDLCRCFLYLRNLLSLIDPEYVGKSNASKASNDDAPSSVQ